MLIVLNETPGVTDAKLGVSLDYEGKARPYLEYRASETPSWTYVERVEIDRARDDPARGPFWFMVTLPGLQGPPRPLVSGNVMQGWKVRCGVNTVIKFL